MVFENLWPLIFLLAVPVIFVFYLLKQKAKDQEFSSTLLWKEIYKNIEAKHPFEKFKNNILMYIQILLVLLFIAALMAPILKNRGKAGKNVVLILDNSASMEYLYKGEQTRLDAAKEQAEALLGRYEDNDSITLISCGSEPEVMYQGTDKATVKRRIRDITITNEAGTLSNSTDYINSLVADMENVEIVCYTDTEFDSTLLTKSNADAGISVYSVYSGGKNCTLNYVNYLLETTEQEAAVKTLASVTNYGKEAVTQDISLYMDGQIQDVQELTIASGETTTIYFKELSIDREAMPVLTAELSDGDSLTADNAASVQATDGAEKKILLLTEGNVFLEKALSLEPSYQVYKTDSVDTLMQADEAFDLYVFDGIAISAGELEALETDAGFMFWNYSEIPALESITMEKQVSNEVLSFAKTDEISYLEDYAFGISETATYLLPDWATPLIETSEGGIAAFYGEQDGRRIAVAGFDIHDTDIALRTEFPIFISQLESYVLGQTKNYQELNNFPTTESDVTAAQEINGSGNNRLKLAGGKNIRNILLAAILLLLVVEWIIYVIQVHTRKKLQYLVIRSVVLLLIILAMAGISIVKKGHKSQTIFVVDASDSMGENMDAAVSYVKKQVADLPKDNQYSLVIFGKDAACWQFMTDNSSFPAASVQVVTSATNIEKAVSMAANLYDEDAWKQMVLITDGCENEGNMNLAAKTLKGQEIELYGISMEQAFGQRAEVYIENLQVPSVIHEGDVYNLTVSVVSNIETDAVLTLYQGRNVKGQQEIHVTKGENKFVFSDTGAAGTIASYKAVIEPEQDTEYVNNTYVTYAEIDAKPRVLLIEGKNGEASEFEKVLKAANMDYDIVTPTGAPITVSELNQYKAVITLDVYYDDLRTGFAEALQTFVRDYAGGYICIGGENSYALGGYRGTVLEEMLPVNMDLQGEKQIPKLAMTMVIDQSGSMCSPAEDNSQVTGLTLAKQAAVSGVKELRETDDVGVLAFDDKYNWVVKLQQASDTGVIQDKIETIGYGGGTSIYPALQEAYRATLESDAVIKHIILLTDGQDEFHDYDDLIAQINDAGITVSTVAVGTGADKKTLQSIASACGGRFYYTDVNTSIPRIFAQEVYLSTNTYLVNEEFYPEITSSNPMLDGVLDSGIPMLYGYVATSPKQTADVILESAKGDPILSVWQYGLGKTLAWCSDATNEWTAQFALWEDYPYFWSNLIQSVITDTRLGEDSLEVTGNGNGAEISYETKEYDADTKVMAVITDDEGNSTEVELKPVKPGTFQADADLDEVGIYSINIRRQNGDTVEASYNTAYASQYSREYQFTNLENSLEAFCRQAGGSLISMEDDIWTFEQNKMKVKKPLTMIFLVLAFLLLIFDIAARRLALDLTGGMRTVWRKLSGRRTNQRRKDTKTGMQAEPTLQKKANEQAEQILQKKANEQTAQTSQKKANRQAEETLQTGKAEKRRRSEKKQASREKQQSENAQGEMLDMATLLKKKQERDK